MVTVLEWTQEAVDAEIAYRDELRRMRDAQGMLGHPVPLAPWWTVLRRRVRRHAA